MKFSFFYHWRFSQDRDPRQYRDICRSISVDEVAVLYHHKRDNNNNNHHYINQHGNHQYYHNFRGNHMKKFVAFIINGSDWLSSVLFSSKSRKSRKYIEFLLQPLTSLFRVNASGVDCPVSIIANHVDVNDDKWLTKLLKMSNMTMIVDEF